MDRFDFCRALARDAGTIARAGFGVAASTLKGRHDVVTEKDREVERFVRRAIDARYPGDAIIGEDEGWWPESYADAGIMTKDAGLVLNGRNGEQFQITVVRSR